MRVAIVANPSSDEGGLSLRRDVELVRAAVLYADELEFISIPMTVLASVFQLAAAGEAGVLEFVRELPDDTMQAIAPNLLALANWREPVHSLPPSGSSFEREALLSTLRSAAPDIEVNAYAMLSEAGGEELLLAIGAGVLTLSDGGFADNSDDPVAGRAELLQELLAQPSTRVLLRRRRTDRTWSPDPRACRRGRGREWIRRRVSRRFPRLRSTSCSTCGAT